MGFPNKRVQSGILRRLSHEAPWPPSAADAQRRRAEGTINAALFDGGNARSSRKQGSVRLVVVDVETTGVYNSDRIMVPHSNSTSMGRVHV